MADSSEHSCHTNTAWLSEKRTWGMAGRLDGSCGPVEDDRNPWVART